MKRHLKTAVLLCIAFATALATRAQTKVGYRIKIKPTAKVTKLITSTACPDTILKGAELKEETIKNGANSTLTITRKQLLAKDTIIMLPKKTKKDIYPDAGGLANVFIDEKDKSLLHINYWLNPSNTLAKGTIIKRTVRSLICDDKYSEKTTTDTLEDDKTYELYKIELKDYAVQKGKKWFITTDEIIEVLDKTGKTAYYLVDRYDRDADYQMTLKNREFISYPTSWIEYGPIIIPVKYRFERTKNGKTAKDQFQSDLNIGVYAGYNTGRYRLRNDGGTLTELSPVALSLGGFINFGTASIDSLATNLSNTPLAKDETATIGVFSPGLGAMLSVHNLQIGLYTGIDFGMGKNARRWNFNNRPWIGFGIAYNVSGFWKK